jgi:hypothetical protein
MADRPNRQLSREPQCSRNLKIAIEVYLANHNTCLAILYTIPEVKLVTYIQYNHKRTHMTSVPSYSCFQALGNFHNAQRSLHDLVGPKLHSMQLLKHASMKHVKLRIQKVIQTLETCNGTPRWSSSPSTLSWVVLNQTLRKRKWF